jgi:hypothetical protein
MQKSPLSVVASEREGSTFQFLFEKRKEFQPFPKHFQVAKSLALP